MTDAPTPDPVHAQKLLAQLRLIESQLDLWDKYVDFDDELLGDDGQRVWSRIATGQPHTGAIGLAYRTEAELTDIRNQSRYLCLTNEFAISALENRTSYTIGSGHTYKAVPRDDEEVPETDLAEISSVIDDFLEANRWHQRQQEIRQRMDRDGECFLRFFDASEGGIIVRFVEPEDVKTPDNLTSDKEVRYGIRFKPRDVETVLAYYIDGESVPAEEIQHRKANVDMTAPRGVPTLHAVRKNLTRAAKILRNMSTVTEIQSAIAMVRKHTQGAAQTITQYVSQMADVKVSDRTSGATQTYKRYPPGSILDAPNTVDYQFPAAGASIDKYVIALQAELRAVASRLVMPEFMLSADASNANFASTMVAEGPSTKMFERLQADTIWSDLEVLKRAVQAAIDAGRLPADTLDRVDLDADAPQIVSRDRSKDVAADNVLVTAGVMSKATLAARNGLDYEDERQNIEREQEQSTGYVGQPPEIVAAMNGQTSSSGILAPDAEPEQSSSGQ